MKNLFATSLLFFSASGINAANITFDSFGNLELQAKAICGTDTVTDQLSAPARPIASENTLALGSELDQSCQSLASASGFVAHIDADPIATEPTKYDFLSVNMSVDGSGTVFSESAESSVAIGGPSVFTVAEDQLVSVAFNAELDLTDATYNPNGGRVTIFLSSLDNSPPDSGAPYSNNFFFEEYGRFDELTQWKGSELLFLTAGTYQFYAGINANAASVTDPVSYSGFLDATVTAVPVPAAVWLFGSALAGVGWMRRRQTT